jgi:hypothetical protein
VAVGQMATSYEHAERVARPAGPRDGQGGHLPRRSAHLRAPEPDYVDLGACPAGDSADGFALSASFAPRVLQPRPRISR